MAQPVHAEKPNTQGMALVDMQLMHIIAVAQDKGAEAGDHYNQSLLW